MCNKKLYLTDEQYKRILLKIKATVDAKNFQYTCFDSTSIGDKYTESNCGLCNDDFTEKNTALFPDDFPKRKTMKYRQAHHKCPFDMRPESEEGIGCFYQCALFHRKPTTIQLREWTDQRIREYVREDIDSETKV